MKRYFFCGKCKRKKEIKNVIIKAALNTILCFFFLIIYICAVFKEFFKNKLRYKNRKQRIKFVQTFKGKIFSVVAYLFSVTPPVPHCSRQAVRSGIGLELGALNCSYDIKSSLCWHWPVFCTKILCFSPIVCLDKMTSY